LQQARSDGRVAPSRAINQRGTVFRLRFHIFGPTIERDAQAVFVAAQSPTSPGHQSLAVAGSRTTAPRRIHSLRRSVNTINSSCDLRLCKLILTICSDMIESICPESDSRLLFPSRIGNRQVPRRTQQPCQPARRQRTHAIGLRGKSLLGFVLSLQRRASRRGRMVGWSSIDVAGQPGLPANYQMQHSSC